MYSRFHYILIGLISVIVYLFYLIAYYKFSEYQIDSFEEALVANNATIESRNAFKENIEQYIRTAAYQTQVAKTSQNKKMPGEELINIISQEDVDGNQAKSVSTVLSEIQKTKADPTANMTNPERWEYLFENGIPR